MIRKIKDIKVPCFKIESFGAVDGPGVRLVIFLQGCPYRCIYCHNPESWKIDNDNSLISVEEVIQKYEKNKDFYRNGGITISGGEPLIHQEFCLELAKQCFDNKIHLAFDTSGCTFIKANLSWFKKIIKYKPHWLIDIKHIDENKHKVITGFKNTNEIDLIKFLEKCKQHYWLRQVLLPNYTDDKNDLITLSKFIKKLKYIDNFELLPYHELALDKYKQLNIKYPLKNKTHIPKQKEIELAKKYFN